MNTFNYGQQIKEESLQINRLINGAFWLVSLRWLAILIVIITLLFVYSGFKVRIDVNALLIIVLLLIAENSTFYLFLLKSKKKDRLKDLGMLKIIINIQIILDLIFLTSIIHFTGGIENPFFLFFLFHLVISSLFLSKTNSYLICAFAFSMISLLTFLEYTGTIGHYSFWNNNEASFYSKNNLNYIVLVLAVFGFTSFLLVYMANTVVSIIRKQEKTLQDTNIQLLRKDIIKNEYVLRLTHDIKGHLAAIQINLSLITDNFLGELNQRQRESISNIYDRSVRLTDFVNRLLNLTYMRLNNKIEIEIFSIQEAVMNTVALVKELAEKKSIHLRYFVDDRLNQITSNKFSFEELLSSVLLNAIRYTRDNGKIDLVVKDKNDKVQIEVSDNGIGIPEKELHLIFDEFYRATNAKNFKKHGTGLGLAIVKEIVTLYGGKIWVESKLDIGTTFYISFPKNISKT